MRAYFAQQLMNFGLRLVSRYNYGGSHLLTREQSEELFTNYQSRFIEIDGLKVHYRDTGEGEVIVLVHGFAASLHIWNAWVKSLEKRYRVIRVDLPGFGLSEFKNFNDQHTVKYYTNFLNNFLKEVGVESFHLAGNSLGGWICWEFAAEFPQLVKKLVLISAAGYFDGETHSKTRALAKTKDFRKLLKSGVPKFIIKRLMENSYGDKSKISRFEVDLYYGLANSEGNLASLIKLANTTIKPRPEKIKEIHTPTLIMWGSDDNVVKLSNANQFHADLPDSELVIYEGVGHIPQVEIPLRSVADLEAFLEKNSSKAELTKDPNLLKSG